MIARCAIEGAEERHIHIAAALIMDDQGRLLLVRKRGTGAFMQAGGKIDMGEGAAECLKRELWEELGLDVSHKDMRYLGHTPPRGRE